MLKTISRILNFPAFSAYQSTSQSVSNNTWTKVNLQTEFFDTNDNFASSRFMPTVAGYYQFNGNLQVQTTAAFALIDIYKNGASTGYRVISSQASVYFATGGTSTILYMNGSTDYVELYAYQSTGVAVDLSTVITQFNGSMIRGA